MSDLNRFQHDLLNAFRPDAIQKIGEGMKNALVFHSRWLGEFNKSVVCRTPFSEDWRLPEGDCRCAFGSWVSLLDDTPLVDHVEIEKLRKVHASLHASARELILQVEKDSLIAPEEYESFLSTHESFISKLIELTYEVIRADLKFDSLTGTLGRQTMEEMVRREHLRVERTGTSACIAMVDIDHLKELNDAFGHSFGSRVISEVARRFTKGLRSYDLLFRYGGDEFLICLPNADLVTAREILERLRGSLVNVPMLTLDGEKVTTTASFGMAQLSGGSMDECIERADQALYRAKQGGRNMLVEHGQDI